MLADMDRRRRLRPRRRTVLKRNFGNAIAGGLVSHDFDRKPEAATQIPFVCRFRRRGGRRCCTQLKRASCRIHRRFDRCGPTLTGATQGRGLITALTDERHQCREERPVAANADFPPWRPMQRSALVPAQAASGHSAAPLYEIYIRGRHVR